MRPITEIERCLQVARRDVFSPDDAIATAASSRITMLLAELAAHPEEQQRRAAVQAANDARLLFRWA